MGDGRLFHWIMCHLFDRHTCMQVLIGETLVDIARCRFCQAVVYPSPFGNVWHRDDAYRERG